MQQMSFCFNTKATRSQHQNKIGEIDPIYHLTVADLSVHVFAKTSPWTTFLFSVVAHVSRSSQVLVDIVKSSFYPTFFNIHYPLLLKYVRLNET